MSAKAHPITIAANLWRVRWMVVVPLVRGFLHAAGGGGIIGWLHGTWVDLLVFLCMLTLSYLYARRVSLCWDERTLEICGGFFIQNQSVIPWDRLATISVIDAPYLRVFRAVRLKVDILGGPVRSPDFTLYLSPGVAKKLCEWHEGENPGEIPKVFRPTTLSVLVESLLSSNSLGGVAVAATFFSGAGRLVGRQLTDGVVGALEELTRSVNLGIFPPAAAAVAYILLAGWAISFILTFCRYKGMEVRRVQGLVEVSGGLLTRRRYSIRTFQISYLNIRQSLLTRLLGLYSLSLSVVGFARMKGDIACLIPAGRPETASRERERIFPGFNPASPTLTTEGKGVFRFILEPLIPIGGIIFAAAATFFSQPGFGVFTLFAGGMAMLPALYFLAVRLVDFKTGGISMGEGKLTLSYSRGFYLHTVMAEREKVITFRLRQSFFQRRKGKCDVIVYTRTQGRSAHLLRGLPLSQAKIFLERVCER